MNVHFHNDYLYRYPLWLYYISNLTLLLRLVGIKMVEHRALLDWHMTPKLLSSASPCVHHFIHTTSNPQRDENTIGVPSFNDK
mmetsp:Transcript_43353/g.63635  ORF Transcript_43353/g.63635 Transcript_43353/m.63635 type:complete len:83 (-) Transcript_43353:1029-1277(-)